MQLTFSCSRPLRMSSSPASSSSSGSAHRRAGRPKSKKGCITCKIRHVKCGEEKPECSQCTRSGRKCDGYNDASQRELHQEIIKSVPRQSWASPTPDQRIVLVPGTWQERQYVHFFCNETIKAMSGFFPSNFWSQHLPELSYRSPPVRHAVAAVGAMHERQLRGKLVSHSSFQSTDKDDAFALEQYNKAIQSFLEQMGNPKTMDVELMLVQCLLFVCLEMLKGNIARAMDHAQGGLKILAGQLSDGKITESQRAFHKDLYQFFYRQNVQVALFGRTIADLPEGPAFLPPCPTTFHNISEARHCLTHLMNQGLSFIQKLHYQSTLSSVINDDQIKDQQTILRSFQAWYQAMLRLQTKSPKSIEVLDPRAPSALLCEYHASAIWIGTCMTRQEMHYDNFLPDFEAIANHAEKVISLSRKSDYSTNVEQFNLDAEVLPMIYYAVQRCRFPLLRRRLLAAYEAYPAREGLWDKTEHAAILKRNIEIEEAHYTHLPIEQRIPQEHHRIVELLVRPGRENPLKPCPVLIQMRPSGPEGPQEDSWEYIDW